MLHDATYIVIKFKKACLKIYTSKQVHTTYYADSRMKFTKGLFFICSKTQITQPHNEKNVHKISGVFYNFFESWLLREKNESIAHSFITNQRLKKKKKISIFRCKKELFIPAG